MSIIRLKWSSFLREIDGGTDKGFTDKVKGKVTEVVSEATKNDALKAEGLVDQVVGKTKEVVSGVKDAVVEIAEKAREAINTNKDR